MLHLLPLELLQAIGARCGTRDFRLLCCTCKRVQQALWEPAAPDSATASADLARRAMNLGRKEFRNALGSGIAKRLFEHIVVRHSCTLHAIVSEALWLPVAAAQQLMVLLHG